MLYKIDDKFYIDVQGYYKEVDIKVNGDNLDVTSNGNEIEKANVLGNKVQAFDVRINKKDIIDTLKKKDREQEHELLSSTRTRQNNRNKRL